MPGGHEAPARAARLRALTPSLSIIRTSLAALDLPGSYLRRRAVAVDFDAVGYEERRLLAAGLVEVIAAERRGVGIAAPMCGIGLRMIALAVEDRVLAMANPEVVATSEERVRFREANLCLPGVAALVDRPRDVTVRWRSVGSGQEREETFTGWTARVVQHELDLLDGRMFVDHVEPEAVKVAQPQRERAASGAAAWAGEPEPPPWREPFLDVVTLPMELAALEHTVLRTPAAEVDVEAVGRERLRDLVESLLFAQYEATGVGLAAPQVGYGLRLAVVDDRISDPVVLLNPRIVEPGDDLATAHEGCLSLPGWDGAVERPHRVTVVTHGIDGTPSEQTFEGGLARAVQHEIDHLDGVLYPDRMAEGTAPERHEELEPAEAVRNLWDEEAAASRASSTKRPAPARRAKPPKRRRR